MNQEKGEAKQDFEALLRHFSAENAMQLRKQSNVLIKRAALSMDSVQAKLSVLCYVLHKLLSKDHVYFSQDWKEEKQAILSCLAGAGKLLERGEEKKFERDLATAFVCLGRVDREAGRYMQSLYDKACIRAASSAHYAGLSIRQAAFLTGADTKSLQEYVGFTREFEHREEKMLSIRERLDALKTEWDAP